MRSAERRLWLLLTQGSHPPVQRDIPLLLIVHPLLLLQQPLLLLHEALAVLQQPLLQARPFGLFFLLQGHHRLLCLLDGSPGCINRSPGLIENSHHLIERGSALIQGSNDSLPG